MWPNDEMKEEGEKEKEKEKMDEGDLRGKAHETDEDDKYDESNDR